MLDNDVRSFCWLQKKCSGKLESFVHKLIKNNHTLIQLHTLFQLQGSSHDSTQRPLPLRSQNPTLRHVTWTISAYDTWLRSFVTLTRHFDNSSQRQKSVSFGSFFVEVTDCRNDVSKWRMVEVTCRSDRWLKSRVEVKDFGAWEGVALVSKWRVPATGGLCNPKSWLKIFKHSQT